MSSSLHEAHFMGQRRVTLGLEYVYLAHKSMELLLRRVGV